MPGPRTACGLQMDTASGAPRLCSSSLGCAALCYSSLGIIENKLGRFGPMRSFNHFVNQFSFALFALFALLASVAAAYFWLPLPVGLVLVALVGAALAGIGAGLRYRQTHIADLTDLDSIIGKGRPVMVVVFSNF